MRKMKTIDFDEKFHKYYEKWLNENKGKFTADELEDKVPEVYGQWLHAFDEQLGASVCDYLSGKSDGELIDMFIDSFEGDGDPSGALLDEIEGREACSEMLVSILEGNYSDEIKMHAANMLLEAGKAELATGIFTEWVLDPSAAPELRDVAVEVLAEYADKVKNELIVGIDGADFDTKTLIAEVLIRAQKDEKTFALLTELFESGKNTALFAGYLGKYGDERAAATLYKALDKCNYLEFTEIRNAIEVLGGVVDDEYRDFTDDEYYKAIKNLK